MADHGVRLFSIAGVCLPVFWVALMLQLLVGVKLGILPVYGSISPLLAPPRVTGLDVIDSLMALNFSGLLDSLKHLVLPAIALGLYIAAYISRMTRSNLVEAFSQEYIVTARAKGLPQKMIIYKHALRNAMLPIMTISVYQFAYLLGGSTVTELVFSWPGLGSLFFHALSVRDFPLLQGMMIFVAIVLAFFTVLMDVLNYYFDPRVRVG
jgi:peptide/nickel transport system permease protein